MALVGSPQLQFHFISAIAIGVLKQKVEAPCVGLPPLFVLENQVTEPKDPRVVRYPVLHPSLVELSVILQPNAIVLNEFHMLLSRFFLVGITSVFLPRRLIVAPAAVGCKARVGLSPCSYR